MQITAPVFDAMDILHGQNDYGKGEFSHSQQLFDESREFQEAGSWSRGEGGKGLVVPDRVDKGSNKAGKVRSHGLRGQNRFAKSNIGLASGQERGRRLLVSMKRSRNVVNSFLGNRSQESVAGQFLQSLRLVEAGQLNEG